MPSEEEIVGYRFTATGQGDVVRAAGAVDAAFLRNASAASKAQAASAVLDAQLNRFTPTFSALGAAISRVTPEVGGFFTAIGRAGGSIAGITSALGGVPGMVAGGLVAAVGLYAESARRAKEDTEQLTKAQEASAKAMAEQAKAASDLADKLLNMTSGGAARRAAERATIAPALDQLRAQFAGEADPAERARLSAEITRHRQALRKINEDEQNERLARNKAKQDADTKALLRARGVEDDEFVFDPISGEMVKISGKKPAAKKDPFRPTIAGIEEFQRLDRGTAKLESAAAERRAMVGQMLTDDQLPQKRQKADVVDLLRARQHSDALVRIRDEEREKMKRIEEQMREDRVQTQRVAIAGFEAVAGVGLKSLNAMAKGQKISAKAAVAAVGDELFAKGLSLFLEGGGKLILGNPAGALAMAHGGVMMGVGTVMGAAGGGGAAGGRVAGVSGAGGFGGGNRNSIAPVSPVSGFVGGSPFGSQQNVTIHLSTLADGPEIGERIVRAIQKSNAHGRTSVPLTRNG